MPHRMSIPRIMSSKMTGSTNIGTVVFFFPSWILTCTARVTARGLAAIRSLMKLRVTSVSIVASVATSSIPQISSVAIEGYAPFPYTIGQLL